MLKRYPYILIFCIALLSTLKVTGQIAMPDNVCVGETKQYRVDQHTGSSYEWKIDGVIVQSGPSNELVHTWNVPNTYTIEVQESSSEGCIGLPSTGQVIVHPNVTPTFDPIPAICSGATPPTLPLTSTNGITGTWSPAFNNTATTEYTFTPTAGQCANTATLTITVNPNVTPTFDAVAAICSGATLNALPTTSLNGITGTWSPALDNTTTTTYTFTPTAGQCATTATLIITVNPNVTPTFDAVAAICSGATLTHCQLLLTNGITGTWARLWIIQQPQLIHLPRLPVSVLLQLH